MNPDYQYSTSNNTRRYNASLRRFQPPPAYANEPTTPAKRPFAAPTTQATAPALPPAKRPRKTLQLLEHDRVSPAELARRARESKGLAVPRTQPVLETIAEKTAEPDSYHTPDRCDPVFGSTSLVTSANASEPSGTPAPEIQSGDQAHNECDSYSDPDVLAAWSGMPLPRARADQHEPSNVPLTLPNARTSEGKVCQMYRTFVCPSDDI